MSDPKIRGYDYTNGVWRWVAVDSSGELIWVRPTATRVDSGAAETSGVISAVAATPVMIMGRNLASATRYLLLFDLAAVPANGTAPDLVPIELAAGEAFSLELPPEQWANGIVWASSTTDLTLTLTGVADMWLTAYYR